MPAAGRDALKQRVLPRSCAPDHREQSRRQSPWSLDPGDIGDGRRFDDFVLVQSQGTWFTYSFAARKRQVSNYQFRAPKEWFAEAYVWYYEPDPRGRGMKLNDKDHDTKVWFDNNVQTIV